MFKKEEKEKFVAVPQVEIDGDLFHESAEISFSFRKKVEKVEKNGNIEATKTYSLVKKVEVRGKIAKETVLRSEEGPSGKLIILSLAEIEIRKELKRLEEV